MVSIIKEQITAMIFPIKILVAFAYCIIGAAYLSWFERKIIARIQMRLGPSYTGYCGLMQPIADAIKLIFKKNALTGHSKKAISAICIFMITSLLSITLIPFSENIYLFDPKYGLLYILILHTICSLAEIIIGIESNSKYGIIGGTRAYYQAISSFLPFTLGILCIALITNTFNLNEIIFYQKNISFVFILPPVFITFFIATLMSLNRTPFDFTEAESEIIAGNYVEYGGILFAMIYLSEYLNLIFSSAVIVILFLGGWQPLPYLGFLPSYISLSIKTILIMTIIISIRAILPRYRQQYAIYISWGVLCPITILYMILIKSI